MTAALAEHHAHGTQLLRSELEARFVLLVDLHGLPRPQLNATVLGMEVDALWPDAAVVVELDGWAFHRTRGAFQRDRDRSGALTDAGYRVLRFTHADVTRRAPRVAARIARALSGAG